MNPRHWLLSAAAIALLVAASRAAEPDQAAPGEEPRFLRLKRDRDDQPKALQTAIRSYTLDDGQDEPIRVDLVGVIHIGEGKYYKRLNKIFRDYDAVLYELVADREASLPDAGRGPDLNPISMLQGGMRSLLELEFQLDHIDYRAENFIHADMTPDEMAEMMAQRDESPLKMFARMLGHSIAQQAQSNDMPSDIDLVRAMFSPDRATVLKRLLAQQFATTGGQIPIFDGPEGSTIITERNKVALEVMDRSIEAGHRRLAIFYGAGHMPHMHRVLLADRGMERDPEGDRWLTAWQLRPQDAEKQEEEPALAQ